MRVIAANMTLAHEALSKEIIPAAIAVHRDLRLDLLAAKRFVVELRAVKEIENVHFAVVRSYLSALKLDHGIILNFAKTKVEMKRVIRGHSRDLERLPVSVHP